MNTSKTMSEITHPGLLSPVLRRLPARLLAALDAWSYRVAQERARKRREIGLRLAQQRSGN